MAALGIEASHMGRTVETAFAQQIERSIDMIADLLPGPKQTASNRAARLVATLVGAVVMARATGYAGIGQEVIDACREQLGS